MLQNENCQNFLKTTNTNNVYIVTFPSHPKDQVSAKGIFLVLGGGLVYGGVGGWVVVFVWFLFRFLLRDSLSIHLTCVPHSALQICI